MRQPQTAQAKPIALSMGEPAGIGGEIALGAWLQSRGAEAPAFYLIDDPRRLDRLARHLGWEVPLRSIADPAEAAGIFKDELPVLAIDADLPFTPGRPVPDSAEAVLNSIRTGVAHAREGAAAALCTNPIHKGVLMEAGFRHAGHTDYLAELAGVSRSAMMLACPGLRVVPVTVHIPLARVPAALTTCLIAETARIVSADLKRWFGLTEPRLAVSGLNPHAGEGGALGGEEDEIIRPAIEALRSEGFQVTGPHAADSLFHEAARAGFDAALCMYHDQALIAIKTLDFAGAVNVTLGLPFIRTSPDHGTAFDIAGSGRANPSSLIAALRLAAQMARNKAA